MCDVRAGSSRSSSFDIHASSKDGMLDRTDGKKLGRMKDRNTEITNEPSNKIGNLANLKFSRVKAQPTTTLPKANDPRSYIGQRISLRGGEGRVMVTEKQNRLHECVKYNKRNCWDEVVKYTDRGWDESS